VAEAHNMDEERRSSAELHILKDTPRNMTVS
jgi:hypothetical protein